MNIGISVGNVLQFIPICLYMNLIVSIYTKESQWSQPIVGLQKLEEQRYSSNITAGDKCAPDVVKNATLMVGKNYGSVA